MKQYNKKQTSNNKKTKKSCNKKKWTWRNKKHKGFEIDNI